jgi:hypothetical protein
MIPPPPRFTRVNSTGHDPTSQLREHDCLMGPLACTIIVTGVLDRRFDGAFAGLALTTAEEDSQLSGLLADQAQLQGVLRQLYDLGLEVVSFTSTPALHPR